MASENEPIQQLEGIQEFSVLPLRNTVLFPQVVVPLAVGRPKSVKLIEEAVKNERPIAILTQKDPEEDQPDASGVYHVGTLARILKVVKIASDNYSVIIQGQQRLRLRTMQQEEPFFVGEFDMLPEPKVKPGEEQVEIEALFMNLKSTAKQVVKFIPEMPREASQMVDGVNDPGQLCDFVAANSLKASSPPSIGSPESSSSTSPGSAVFSPAPSSSPGAIVSISGVTETMRHAPMN